MNDKQRRGRALRTINLFATQAGMGKEDRLILAQAMFPECRGIESYADLDTRTLERLAIAFRGWKEIQKARWTLGHLSSEAHIVLRRMNEAPEQTDMGESIYFDS